MNHIYTTHISGAGQDLYLTPIGVPFNRTTTFLRTLIPAYFLIQKTHPPQPFYKDTRIGLVQGFRLYVDFRKLILGELIAVRYQ